MDSNDTSGTYRPLKRPRPYDNDPGPDRKRHRIAYQELDDARTKTVQLAGVSNTGATRIVLHSSHSLC